MTMNTKWEETFDERYLTATFLMPEMLNALTVVLLKTLMNQYSYAQRSWKRKRLSRPT